MDGMLLMRWGKSVRKDADAIDEVPMGVGIMGMMASFEIRENSWFVV